MANSASEWRPNGRPMSTIALDFSAALDDLFNLGAVGELAETLQEKNREIENQKNKLEDLEEQLRRADEELRRLEMKHKRMSRRFPQRQYVQELFTQNQSSSDSDESASPGSVEHHHQDQTQQ